MVGHMKLGICTNNRCNKRGSYIVEAAICLPMFLIAILAMSSIILMYACIEESNYILSDELGRASIEAPFVDTSLLLPSRIGKRIKENQSIVEELRQGDYIYRGTRGGYDELIAITYEMRMKSANPFDLASSGEYVLSCMTRAYVGRTRQDAPMSEAELSGEEVEIVYIFPSRGEKYHNEGCSVLHAAYTSAILSSSLKKKYKACRACKSKNAGIGTLVYVFPDEGASYHVGGCDTLQRNYIKVERSVAIERGYLACLKCGG